jgi:DNA polymerase III delta prime subunit
LLFLSLFFPIALSYVCNSFFKWTNCAENESPDAVLKKILKEDGWRGQVDALQQVTSLFKDHLHRKKRSKPLALHFSGPTAVGKTSLAKALARALFQQSDGDKYICGLLLLKMEIYLKHTPSDRMKETFKTVVAEPILEQLNSCPRSVILLDEIQHAHIELLEELKNALDDNAYLTCYPPLCPLSRPQLSTREAIFIMTSDLEPEAAKRLTSDLPKADAIEIIRALSKARWGEGTFGVKMIELIPVVPFLPLTGYDFHKILARKIGELGESIRERLETEVSRLALPYKVRWLGEVLSKKGTETLILVRVDRSLGFRVVDNFLRQHAMPLLDDVVADVIDLAYSTPFTISGGLFGRSTHVILHNVQVEYENKEFTMYLIPGESSDNRKSHHDL